MLIRLGIGPCEQSTRDPTTTFCCICNKRLSRVVDQAITGVALQTKSIGAMMRSLILIFSRHFKGVHAARGGAYLSVSQQ